MAKSDSLSTSFIRPLIRPLDLAFVLVGIVEDYPTTEAHCDLGASIAGRLTCPPRLMMKSKNLMAWAHSSSAWSTHRPHAAEVLFFKMGRHGKIQIRGSKFRIQLAVQSVLNLRL